MPTAFSARITYTPDGQSLPTGMVSVGLQGHSDGPGTRSPHAGCTGAPATWPDHTSRAPAPPYQPMRYAVILSAPGTVDEIRTVSVSPGDAAYGEAYRARSVVAAHSAGGAIQSAVPARVFSV
ncbi:MAG: hypothetical protein IT356_01825 [Gemmatimonadaceae bacterium]|nr:hypothetical protein [Gemmatimonadaceae bacterium]